MAGGRPSAYDNKIQPYLREIGILRSKGIVYGQIAKMLNIAESTLYKHKADIEEFTEALKKGNAELVEKLEATLYDLAIGNVKVTKTKTYYDKEGNVKSKEVQEETLSPNLGALIFNLTNLAPEKWSNKQEVNLDINDDIAPSFNVVLREQHEKDTV